MNRLMNYFLVAALVLLLVFPMTAAWAHGHAHVGDYELEIGFHDEPAYQGEPNGIALFVTNMKTEEPVNGLEGTLKAEIIFGSSKTELVLEPQEEDGAYIAYFIPTEVGDYTMHIFGEIEGTSVDVSMTSAPDTFNSVIDRSEGAFPSPIPGSGQASPMGTMAGILGAVLGACGLVVSLLALRAARRPPA